MRLVSQSKDWVAKLHGSKGLPKVEKITPKMSQRWGQGTIVIPAPIEVNEIMGQVPPGKLITINEIRRYLARKHGATIGCPLTTGIFARIAANAAEQERAAGQTEITPYWRTLKSGGELNEKYPGGIEHQKRLLEEEGQVVIRKGKKYLVKGYAKSLVSFKSGTSTWEVESLQHLGITTGLVLQPVGAGKRRSGEIPGGYCQKYTRFIMIDL